MFPQSWILGSRPRMTRINSGRLPNTLKLPGFIRSLCLRLNKLPYAFVPPTVT
jgi:hypothetical protein